MRSVEGEREWGVGEGGGGRYGGRVVGRWKVE